MQNIHGHTDNGGMSIAFTFDKLGHVSRACVYKTVTRVCHMHSRVFLHRSHGVAWYN